MHFIKNICLHEICDRLRSIGNVFGHKNIVLNNNFVINAHYLLNHILLEVFNTLYLCELLHLTRVSLLELVKDIVAKLTTLDSVLLFDV